MLPPTRAVGPLLSQTWYGQYAYRIYPGPASVETARALTGFRVTIRPASPTTIEVTVDDLQSRISEHATYDGSDQLYFVERDLGDDDERGKETDYADDWFVLTDAAGHVIPP